LRVGYALANEGRGRKNGTASRSIRPCSSNGRKIRLPGAYAALELVLRFLAHVARRAGVDGQRARRYL
jgi:hypothetical protein